MKMTLLIIGVLILGIITGIVLPQIDFDLIANGPKYLLYPILILAGMEIGFFNKKADLKFFLSLMRDTLLVMLGTIAGSYFGGMLASLVFNMQLNQGLAIASGFTWYSLSGVILSEIAGAKIGAVAFVANVLRESLVFLFVPYLCQKNFTHGSISIAGASSMDVSLTVISRYADPRIAGISFLHGTILTFLVPVLVPLMYSIQG